MCSGIQTTVNANEPSCVEMASIMVSWHTYYKLVKVPIFSNHRIFVVWVLFMEVIFTYLNLKTDGRFLRYSMPEVLNKTGHGLTEIYNCLG